MELRAEAQKALGRTSIFAHFTMRCSTRELALDILQQRVRGLDSATAEVRWTSQMHKISSRTTEGN